MGGSYFVRDTHGRLAGVYKPCDEEAYAPRNPRGYTAHHNYNASHPATTTSSLITSSLTTTSSSNNNSPGLGIRAGIPPGEAGVREAAAFVLDAAGGPDVAAGVPPT